LKNALFSPKGGRAASAKCVGKMFILQLYVQTRPFVKTKSAGFENLNATIKISFNTNYAGRGNAVKRILQRY
jgi:hypothetical protein